MPNTAKGEFKNFQLSTTRPERPDEPIKEYIFDLIEKFENIMYNSDLRRGQKDRFSRNFDFVTEYLPDEHEYLVEDECTDSNTYPDTYEDDGEPDETEPCRAIDQIVNRADKWSEIFLYSCRLDNRGKNFLKLHERYMKNVNRVADKAKEKLNC